MMVNCIRLRLCRRNRLTLLHAPTANLELELPPATTLLRRPRRRPKAAGGNAWVPLGVALLVMPALAYAVTTFVLVPRCKILRAGGSGAQPAAKDSSVEAAEGKQGPSGRPKANSDMSELLVNVADTMGSRYLLTTLALAGTGSDFTSRVSRTRPSCRG